MALKHGCDNNDDGTEVVTAVVVNGAVDNMIFRAWFTRSRRRERNVERRPWLQQKKFAGGCVGI